MRCGAVVVGLVAIAACGDAPPDPTDRPTDRIDDDIARLAGDRELTPGVQILDRFGGAGRGAARDWLAEQLAAIGFATEIVDYDTGGNVLGRLPATDGGTAWVVVGAHFDSVRGCPGANDNATGVAVALAVARALVSLPDRRRGALVAFFDEEEAGLIGSTQVAKGLVGTDVVAVHTVDQVGWDEDGDQVLEIERPTDALYAEYEAAADELAMTVRRTDTGGTDHVAFRDRGYAAAGVTEEYAGGDTTPHRHEPGDTYDTVDVDYAIAAARLVTRVVSREVAAESWRP